jgi:hypothetical protein
MIMTLSDGSFRFVAAGLSSPSSSGSASACFAFAAAAAMNYPGWNISRGLMNGVALSKTPRLR